MTKMTLRFFSEVLGRQTYTNVLLPQAMTGEERGWEPMKTNPPFPVLYLLHGLSDDQEAWLRNTSVERYADRRNLAIVLPTTDRGYYTDTTYGTKYFTYISEELPRILRQYLPLSERREDTYAAGLSMGGYGAMKLALRNPERFSFAASLSGGIINKEMMQRRKRERPDEAELMREFATVFGKTVKPEDDLLRLLECASPKPKLFVCCGKKDIHFKRNVAVKKHAEKLGYDLTWSADEGYGHTWDYWDLMIQKVLDILPEQTR